LTVLYSIYVGSLEKFHKEYDVRKAAVRSLL